jgi:hypothetical protein
MSGSDPHEPAALTGRTAPIGGYPGLRAEAFGPFGTGLDLATNTGTEVDPGAKKGIEPGGAKKIRRVG